MRYPRIYSLLLAVNVFFLLVSSPAYAEAANCRRKLFEAFLEQSYVCSKCHKNVANFITFLKSQGEDISKAKALVIYADAPNSSKSYFFIYSAQRKDGAQWGHHVILEWQGRIYDFDYKTVPAPVEAATFFADMARGMKIVEVESLGGETTERAVSSLDGLVVRAIPAEDYPALLESHIISDFAGIRPNVRTEQYQPRYLNEYVARRRN